jgi:hypothetical protein
MKNKPQKPASQIIIYQTESGQTKIEVRLQNETIIFFKAVQNKLHFAIIGKTVTELIAVHAKPNMGLTLWKGDKVRKGTVHYFGGK